MTVNDNPDVRAGSIKPHYSFVSRLLIELNQDGLLPDVTDIILEPEYGFAGRIVYSDGSVRIFKGHNPGVNLGGTFEIANDKAYTKFFLKTLGYNVPRGRSFLLPKYIKLIDPILSGKGFGSYAGEDDLFSFAERDMGFPCYVKPNTAGKGRGVARCLDAEGLRGHVAELKRDGTDIVLIEAPVHMPVYRVNIFRGELVCAYLKRPLAVTGDGSSTIGTLLRIELDRQIAGGKSVSVSIYDETVRKRLAHDGLTFDSVPPAGDMVVLHDVANMPLGGEIEDCTESVHNRWRGLCAQAAADMGAVLCGLDLCCEDIGDPSSDYSILEINASPDLANYASTGETQLSRVREMYRRIFREPPDNGPAL